MIRTIKELDSTGNEDLDAGWDVDESAAPAISVRQPSSFSSPLVPASPVAEEIDAGWDLESDEIPSAGAQAPQATPVDEQPRTRHSEIHLRGTPSSKREPAAQPAISTVPTRQLSKKERRRIERQQRVHAAKKQAETKAERRLQRRQTSEATAAPSVRASAGAHVQSPKKHHRKPKPSLASKPAKSAVSRSAAPPRTEPTHLSNPLVSAVEAAKDRPVTRRSSLVMYVTIGFVLLVLAGLYFLGQHPAGP